MTPEIMTHLLKMDGLIKVYPSPPSFSLAQTKKINDFGTFFIATFCKKKDDYHFLRLFSDGWYERDGEYIKKFESRNLDKNRLPLGKSEEIAKKFYPPPNTKEQERKNFAGYFLVPLSATVCDKYGKKFNIESHKI